jgi:hypothetical protein
MDGSEAVSDPLVDVAEDARRIRQPEVVPPADEIAAQLRDNLLDAPTARPLRDEADALLHGLKGLARDPAFHHTSRTTPKGIAKDFAIPPEVHGAFRLVDAEPELCVEPPEQPHHALARTPRPHVDVAIVGVAHEGVSAFLQLLINFVEQHVRKQRREGTALRRSLVPFHHHPVRQNSGAKVAADESQ